MERAERPKLAAVLLAAGGSRRLGQPKQLVKRDGESLVRRAAGLLLSLGVDPIVVVTGYRSEEVSRQLRGLNLMLVNNPDWELGMGGSIACGARNVPADADGVLVMPCDQWRLTVEDLFVLLSAWKSDISRIIVSSWNNEKSYYSGPPVIFPGEFMHELLFVNGKVGAKPVIDRHREIVSTVELENAAYDVDEPQDLDQFD